MVSRAENSGLLRRLTLGGAVATLPFLSGCREILNYIAEHDAAVIQANGQRDAARIQAGGNSGGNYKKNAPRWEVFTCATFHDFNNDGVLDIENEIVDKGKTEFYVGDEGRYVVALWNCKGKKLRLYTQDSPGAEQKISQEIIIENNNRFHCRSFYLKVPANWHAYWTLDGVNIGEHRITVREDPGKIGSVSKK